SSLSEEVRSQKTESRRARAREITHDRKMAQKRPRLQEAWALQCVLLPRMNICGCHRAGAAEAAAWIAGIAPAKAAYLAAAPPIQSKRFTDHLHFIEKRCTRSAFSGPAKPSRNFPPPGFNYHKRLCGNVWDEESYAENGAKVEESRIQNSEVRIQKS